MSIENALFPPRQLLQQTSLARHPRFIFHFTPTSASWLNAVEGLFALLTNGVSSGASSVPSRNLRKPSTASSTTPTATIYTVNPLGLA
jgi:hypothetical protein